MNIVIIKLTSRGHDVLQSIDNDTFWSKVKKIATEKGVSLTLDLAVAFGEERWSAASGSALNSSRYAPDSSGAVE